MMGFWARISLNMGLVCHPIFIFFCLFFWSSWCSFLLQFFTCILPKPRPGKPCDHSPTSPRHPRDDGGAAEPASPRAKPAKEPRKPAKPPARRAKRNKKERNGVLGLTFYFLLAIVGFWSIYGDFHLFSFFSFTLLLQGSFVHVGCWVVHDSPTRALVQRLTQGVRQVLTTNPRRGVTLPPPARLLHVKKVIVCTNRKQN